MKKLLALVLLLVVAGCGEATKIQDKVQARDAAMNAATAKMFVTRGKTAPGHNDLVALGKVRGYCMVNPEADDIIPRGDNLRQAAYRKYGSQVDGIVDANSFFVNDDYTPEAQGSGGHYECEGTAVHYADAK